MNLASARYFSFNNMYNKVHERYEEIASRMEGIRTCGKFSESQITEIDQLFVELEKIHKETPERHQNLVIERMDTRCSLCRTLPANKTGAHMVPNFLAHPTFSWDGKGKRFHEALNHDFMNAGEKNSQFYGREVPAWRFAKGMGKEIVSDEDIENNVNRLEYDNEFCSHCEDRFGVLESAYAVFYNGYGEEKLPFFQQADVFVFPTFYSNECFPLVLLEAMEQGLPCISTNEGGIAAIVDEGETGFLVPCREVAPLAERISILLKDEALRKRFGEAGRIKFEEEYTLQRFEENIKRCLEACLQK